MVSLVGCIVPRTCVYWRGMRAQPPAAPRNLTRLPDHATYATDDVGRRRPRAGARGAAASAATGCATDDGGDAVSAERGYLREAGNLLFHLSVLVVLVGFALGGLFGYKGGVILVEGVDVLQQPDPVRRLRRPAACSGPSEHGAVLVHRRRLRRRLADERAARRAWPAAFDADLTYQRGAGRATEKNYDLRVNHPLSIGDTDVFLIGHGYAPVITVRDGNGDIAYSGPTVFLPQDQTLPVLRRGQGAGRAKPDADRARGRVLPDLSCCYDGDPVSVFGDDKNPTLSMLVYTGDLGWTPARRSRSTSLDKANADAGQRARTASRSGSTSSPGETVKLPDGLGSVDASTAWSGGPGSRSARPPASEVALAGVVLALIGLLGSLFIRPRRVWVRGPPRG